MYQYWTESELAELLKVSRTFLWEMRTTEGLPFCRLRRVIRYRPEEVMKWLSSHGAPLVPRAVDDRRRDVPAKNETSKKEKNHE